MKKTLALICAAILLLTLTATVFAEGTTDLTTSIEPTYMLMIPESTEIEVGATETEIGYIGLTECNFEAADAVINISYQPFSSKTTSTVIPYDLQLDVPESDPISTVASEGDVSEYNFRFTYHSGDDFAATVNVIIDEEAWNTASAGTYNSTVIFTVDTLNVIADEEFAS